MSEMEGWRLLMDLIFQVGDVAELNSDLSDK